MSSHRVPRQLSCDSFRSSAPPSRDGITKPRCPPFDEHRGTARSASFDVATAQTVQRPSLENRSYDRLSLRGPLRRPDLSTRSSRGPLGEHTLRCIHREVSWRSHLTMSPTPSSASNVSRPSPSFDELHSEVRIRPASRRAFRVRSNGLTLRRSRSSARNKLALRRAHCGVPQRTHLAMNPLPVTPSPPCDEPTARGTGLILR